jgi:hypothetical protein
MKACKVSALPERGLRRVCGAEPQRCEPQSKQLNERKTDTMKTYILRDPKAVQPQNPVGITAGAPATASAILGRPVVVAGTGPALFVGLDVHK